MKKNVSIIISVLVVFSLLFSLGVSVSAKAGTTYYIDSISGNDANAGTSTSKAWKSLSAHTDFIFKPGDKILLKAGGIYEGIFITKCSGTKDAPITLSSYGNIDRDGYPLMTTKTSEHVIVLVNTSNWIIENVEITAPIGGGIHVQCTNAYPDTIQNYINIKKSEHIAGDLYNEMLEEPDEPDVPEEPVSFIEQIKAALEGAKESVRGALDSVKGTVEDIVDRFDEEPEVELINDPGLPAEFICSNITFRNLKMHDISNLRDGHPMFSGSKRAFYFNTSGQGAKYENVTMKDIDIYDCAYGMEIKGHNVEERREYFISPEESYNSNFLYENIRFQDLGYDALIIGASRDSVVRNCSMINTCIYTDGYTAPIWVHWCDNILIENCEVAGTQNTLDGMTVDFDGWTTNSTYQYIYSHDNTCFMKSNTFDNTTKNANNTVRYCLSVNDNGSFNMASFANFSAHYSFSDHAWSMDGLKFYNNTIYNCAPTLLGIISNSVIENNIFIGSEYKSSLAIGLGIGNKIRNNCFYFMIPPASATKNYYCDPGFISADFTNKDSFKLSSSSKLIGKGVQVEEDMGEFDFYGNPLTSVHNIGCYDGEGENQDAVKTERFFLVIKTVIAFFRNLLVKA